MADIINLAKGISHNMDCASTGLNNNILVIGGTGTGKTWSHTEPILTHMTESNLIVTVTKDRIVKKYQQSLKERGYKVYTLNLARPELSSCSFDPIQYLTCMEDVDYLARAIIMANPKKATASSLDPFWDDQATNLLKALLFLTLAQEGQDNLNTLMRLAGLMSSYSYGDNYIGSSVGYLYEEIERKDPDFPGVHYWNAYRSIHADRTMGCIVGSCIESINAMFSPRIVEGSTKHPLFDLERFAREKSCLFLVTSPVNSSQQAFASLLYSQAFKTLFEYGEAQEDGRLPHPVHMICDDFATGCRIPDFDQYISIFREKGISVSLIIQSESQLQALYGERQATTIINGCDTYIYLGGMDISTCKDIAIRTDRPMIEVMSMPVGKLYVMQRGKKPMYASRYPILEDPAYQSITRKENEYEQSL